jgi:hypothetical protein
MSPFDWLRMTHQVNRMTKICHTELVACLPAGRKYDLFNLTTLIHIY